MNIKLIRLFCTAISILFILMLVLSINPSVYLIGFCNIASLLILGNGIRVIQGKFLSPFLLIALCLYVFHSGHLWLALFNVSPSVFLTSFEHEYRTSNYKYILAVYKEITILLILFMQTGLLFVKPCLRLKINSSKSISATKLFRIVFFILYCFSMLFELQRALAVAKTSYGEGYQYSSSLALYVASIVDVLLLFFLYIYRKDRKRFNTFVLLQIVRTLFIMFFVGNRGSSVINLLVTLFIVATYSYLESDKKKLKRIIISVVAFFLIALPFISATRGNDRANIDLDLFVKENSVVESFLEEFGGTATNTFLTIDYVDVLGPSYGVQILGTTLSLFPGSTELFGDIIYSNVSIGNKLNIFHNREFLGGSLISQLFFNFYHTNFLYFSMILFALLVVWNSNALMIDGGSFYKKLFLLSLFSGLMTSVRGEWYNVIYITKMCCYVMLLLYVFKKKLLRIYGSDAGMLK